MAYKSQVPLWLLKDTHYAETFRVAMGRVGTAAGCKRGQAALGIRRAWVSNEGMGKGRCGSG